MGTRAITTIKDNENKTLVVLYRQYDGYQDCHGKELKEFLESKSLVNGISISEYTRWLATGRCNSIANGMGCLAAQLIAKVKDGVGLFYIYPEGAADEWVDFSYTVYPTDSTDSSTLSIKVESCGDLMFEGLVSDYEAVDEHEE